MYFISCIGIVWIIKDSYILLKPRNYLKSKSPWLRELLSCSLCLGFWVGLLFLILNIYLNNSFQINNLAFPFACSAFCWFFDSLLDLIQELTYAFKTNSKNN